MSLREKTKTMLPAFISYPHRPDSYCSATRSSSLVFKHITCFSGCSPLPALFSPTNPSLTPCKALFKCHLLREASP